MILSADTNLFLYAANPASPHHAAALRFFEEKATGEVRFLLCGIVGLQLRNPTIFPKPKSARAAAEFCSTLRANTAWEIGDYEPDVAELLWNWAAETKTGFRHIIDARLAFTLRHHGVTHFATANVEDFRGFGFDRVWNPLAEEN